MKEISRDNKKIIDGFYSVKVQIQWNPIQSPSSTIEAIEVEQLNISLQVKADK